MTSEIIIPDASTLAVDTSCIDLSEVELQEDKDFLVEKGENILRIVAKAALEVGRELVEIQKHFKTEKAHGLGLNAYYKSLGISPTQASNWACKYRAYVAYVEMFGESGATETFKSLGDRISTKLWHLPEDYKKAFFEEMNQGNIPSQSEILEVAKDPEVKLTKAQELLAKSKARKQEASDWRERGHASDDIKKYEQQIADLTAQIEEEKLKTAEEAESKKIAEAERASMEKELQKLKFDDAKVRSERVKKLSTTLTVSLPQALADVSKFFAEINDYPEEVRQHIYNSAKVLANEIADKL